MKIKLKLIIPMLFIMVLSGCSAESVESSLRDQINEKLIAAVGDTADYQAYLALKEKGLIDENGNYLGEDIPASAEQQPTGDIHITFAKNGYIDVQYFYDEDLTKPVDVSNCYINAGDSIYCSEPIVRSAISSAYEFVEFRVWLYASDNAKGRYDCDNGGNVVLSIPEGATVKELSVEPVGTYRNRTLYLTDYYIDHDGEELQPYGSSWMVNDVTYPDKESVEIHGLLQYEVRYLYDAEEYFVKETTPKCYSIDDSSGVVCFYPASALDDTDAYKVVLSPCVVAAIDMPSVSVKSMSISDDRKLDELRPGDVITIETASDYKVVCSQVEIPVYEKLKDGYRFALTVPEDVGKLDISVRKWLEKNIKFSVDRELLIPSENDLLLIKIGDRNYTYRDFSMIISEQDITMKEFDSLVLTADEDMRYNHNLAFSISVNDEPPQYIHKFSEIKSLEYNYSQTDIIKLEKIYGYAFSYDSIDNKGLKVNYTLSNGTSVAEGQFLPEGTEVTMEISHLINEYSLIDTRFDKNTMKAVITIGKNTRPDEFCVKLG